MYDYAFMNSGIMARLFYEGEVYLIEYRSLDILDELELDELDRLDIKSTITKAYKRSIGVPGNAYELCRDYNAIHPVTNKKNNLYEIVMDLNDGHMWTREQIADWLDTLPEQPVMKMGQ